MNPGDLVRLVILSVCLSACGSNSADGVAAAGNSETSIADGAANNTGSPGAPPIVTSPTPINLDAQEPPAKDYLADSNRPIEPRFGPPREFTRLGYTKSAKLVDLDGDGKLDLVAVSIVMGANTQDPMTQVLSISRGDGSGNFLPETTLFESSESIQFGLADFNADGRPDILLSPNPQSMLLLLSDSVSGFRAPLEVSIGSNLSGFEIGDLNGDGLLDIVTSYAIRGYVGVLLGEGSGVFREGIYTTILEGRIIALVDVDGDRKLDLVARSNAAFDLNLGRVAVLRGDGNGGFMPAIYSTLTLDRQDSLSLGDVNIDGRLDLAVSYALTDGIRRTPVVPRTSFGRFALQVNAGTATFSPEDTYSIYPYPGQIVLADMNGDGKLDLVIPAMSPNLLASPGFLDCIVLLALGDGSGKFWRPNSISLGKPVVLPLALVADLNSDGKLDIIIAPQAFGSPPKSEPITVLLAE